MVPPRHRPVSASARRQPTTTWIVWRPDAPLGKALATDSSWALPAASTTRTCSSWSPGAASQPQSHWRQNSMPASGPRLTSAHPPRSTRTCTFPTPTPWAHAVPPTLTLPDETWEPGRGTSIRELGLMGPWSDQPSTVQYACLAAKVVTSIFTSHFVAPTNPYRPGVSSRTGKPLSLIHISEPTRQAEISYAVFCLKK